MQVAVTSTSHRRAQAAGDNRYRRPLGDQIDCDTSSFWSEWGST
jgi:hypothetical protein